MKSLNDFDLYYEEMERRPVKTKQTNVSKVSLKDRVSKVKSAVRSRFNNTTKRNQPRKKAKKAAQIERQLARKQKIRGIIGIGLLFVVVSIAYSTYMTNLFVDGPEMVAALAPQVAFAVITLVIAFYKIYK